MNKIKAYLALIDSQLLHHMRGKNKWFIDVFREQEYLKEEAFERRIRGDKYDEVYYRKLKSRVIKVLQALAVVSEPRGKNLVKKNYEICQKNFLIGQKMLTNEQRKVGIHLIEDAYTIAIDYDFTHLACELAGILYHHEVYYGKKNKPSRLLAERYAQEMRQYTQNYVAEKEAEYHFYKIVGLVGRALTPEPIREAIEHIQHWKSTSVRFHVFKETLNNIYGFHIGNFQFVISSSHEALKHLLDRKGIYNNQYFSFYKDIGVAQMCLAQYVEAQESLDKSAKYVLNRSYNDYWLRLYKTMNALRAGWYQEAYELYQQNQKCPEEVIRRQFAIVEAYLHFMVYTGRLELDKPFRMRKYLNNTFKSQADKKGENIAVVIAELLMYLAKDRGKFIDKVETAQGYSYRHLKGKDTQRAKWFIRILCMMPRANFHPIALTRLAKKQIENLKATSNSTGYNAGIEIIPFGELLDMIMKHLQRKVA